MKRKEYISPETTEYILETTLLFEGSSTTPGDPKVKDEEDDSDDDNRAPQFGCDWDQYR